MSHLNVTYSGLTKLDVSKLTALVELYCYSNSLTELDVSKNLALEYLDCDENDLTELDVSKNVELRILYCSSNNLDTLNMGKITKLSYLNCNLNNLTELDVSKNVELRSLYCHSNNLSALDVSKNVELTGLYCGFNNLKTLDVSKNTKLLNLYCQSNNLNTLDVSKNTVLLNLYCPSNNLTTLNVSGNDALVSLNCSSNNLTTLDVSKNIALRDLYCESNSLSALDVSENVALSYLTCSSNKLTTLDVSKNTELNALHCQSNNLTTLNIGSLKNIGANQWDNEYVTTTILSGNSLLLISDFTDWESDFPEAVSVDLRSDGALLTALHSGVGAHITSETASNEITVYTSEQTPSEILSILGQTPVWDEPAASGESQENPIRGTLKLPVDSTMVHANDIEVDRNSGFYGMGIDWSDLYDFITLKNGANEALIRIYNYNTGKTQYYAITINRATAAHNSGAIDKDAGNWSLSTTESEGETAFSILVPTGIPASKLNQAVFGSVEGLYIDSVTGSFEVHGDTLRLRLRGLTTDLAKAEITGITYAVGNDLYRQSLDIPFAEMSGTSRGSSGSSGCSAAPAAILLLLPAVAAMTLRRYRR